MFKKITTSTWNAVFSIATANRSRNKKRKKNRPQQQESQKLLKLMES